MGLPAKIESKTEGGFEINIDFKDLGEPNSLRYAILTGVLGGRYDTAIGELKKFVDHDSVYPNFKQRVYRYVNHSTDLIYAIKTKRNFPGMSSLTRAKQQELYEKFKQHFYELQFVLKKIEKIQKDLRIEDVRSTVYVVRAMWYSGFAILCLAFVLDVINGMAVTTYLVFSDLSTEAVGWLFSLF